jgi:hypothetical protein
MLSHRWPDISTSINHKCYAANGRRCADVGFYVENITKVMREFIEKNQWVCSRYGLKL